VPGWPPPEGDRGTAGARRRSYAILGLLCGRSSNPPWRIAAPKAPRNVPLRFEASSMTGSLLTASDVAKLLGVPKSWVYEQPRAGRIPTVTLGRYRRYRREAIEAWLEDLEEESVGGRRKRRAA